MTERNILVNRAPVLTLWATIVAERLGFDHDGTGVTEFDNLIWPTFDTFIWPTLGLKLSFCFRGFSFRIPGGSGVLRSGFQDRV